MRVCDRTSEEVGLHLDGLSDAPPQRGGRVDPDHRSTVLVQGSTVANGLVGHIHVLREIEVKPEPGGVWLRTPARESGESHCPRPWLGRIGYESLDERMGLDWGGGPSVSAFLSHVPTSSPKKTTGAQACSVRLNHPTESLEVSNDVSKTSIGGSQWWLPVTVIQ